MLRIFFFLFLYVFSTSYVLSDISIKSLNLGVSPEGLQTQLKSEGFIFLSISKDKIEARKLAYVSPSDVNRFKQYQSFIPSTVLSAEICNGRVYKVSYQTVFRAQQKQLLMGRKEIYQYLVDNEAQLQRIGINQNETSSQVVETFVIDRNAGQGPVKGEEKVAFALAESSEFQDALKLDVRMSNNWFCPE